MSTSLEEEEEGGETKAMISSLRKHMKAPARVSETPSSSGKFVQPTAPSSIVRPGFKPSSRRSSVGVKRDDLTHLLNEERAGESDGSLSLSDTFPTPGSRARLESERRREQSKNGPFIPYRDTRAAALRGRASI